MKLEDVFKTKEPTNYVDKASQAGASPLQQFLKERTPKPAVIAATTPKAAAPLDEKAVNQIKMEYSPVAEEPMAEEIPSEYSSQSSMTRSPASESYISTSDLLDMERIKKQAEVLAPSKTSLGDFLANLTPLAVETLLGRGTSGGVSAGISGESILGDLGQKQKRRQTIEDKLMELKKISAAKPDLEAGRQARFEAAQKEKRKLDDRRLILQTRDKLNQDILFKASRVRYSAANDAINVLNQRNPIGDASVKTLFAKGIFGEVGAMSDKDKADFIGSPQVERKFDAIMSKYVDGLLSEKDRADLIMLAKHMRERAKKDTSRIASGYTSGLKSFGLDPSAVIDPLLRTDDINPIFQASASLPETKYMKDKQGNKYLVKLNKKTGKYEYAD